jgi:ATP-dependent helicase/nuclease subunit A
LARSDVRQWVQYKLDQGIDHVLVDEAQDTSAVQWQIVNAIIEEFFAGDSVRKTARTIFAVGDQKQSIYSFQGADPEKFTQQKLELKNKAGAIELPFEDIRLPISFRSTRDVLSAVDKVFENPANAQGLETSDEAIIHEPVRAADPGEVLIWPMIEHQKTEKQEDWLLPIDHIGEDHPTLQLAKQIARTVKSWIEKGEMLPGKGRPITHGDVLVLVRKRDRFASSITRELKQAGLSVAGADRLNLATHIAVEDLLSFAKWVLYPEDDLSLAEILKSPILDLDEEELFALCIDRNKQSLWQSLCLNAKSAGPGKLACIQQELSNLLTLAATLPPYEFFSEILSSNSGRRKFKSRLGDEVDDVLDAFMLEALNHTNNGGTGLQEFIDVLETSAPDIKRELDLQKDEIRVMTVHSAKGLEAPIIFLVDPGAPAFSSHHRPSILKIDYNNAAPAFLWQPGKDDGSELTATIQAQFQQKAEEEYRRLLYVAMTRAEDKLIICGYANRNTGSITTWHKMVKDGLIGECEEISEGGEISVCRWIKDHPRRKDRKPAPSEQFIEPVLDELPDWVTKTNNNEAAFAPPLFPSTASLSVEANPREQDIATVNTAPSVQSFAIERGNIIHHLLQFLPSVDPVSRNERATDYIRRSLPAWSNEQQDKVREEVMAILEDESFANLFSQNSQAEVSLSGTLDPEGINQPVNAQIDRIAILEDRVIIIDYKSDRNIPSNPDQISQQYLVQLAIYRELVAQIYDNMKISCALLWTSGPQLVEIPDDLLSEHLKAYLDDLVHDTVKERTSA